MQSCKISGHNARRRIDCFRKHNKHSADPKKRKFRLVLRRKKNKRFRLCSVTHCILANSCCLRDAHLESVVALGAWSCRWACTRSLGQLPTTCTAGGT